MHKWPVRSFRSKENNCCVMQSDEGDRAVNMSHAGFPLSHYSVIEISLETQARPRNNPVNTLLIMVYAHCTDSTSHRQAVNATSCPAAAAIVVLLYTLILHLWSLKAYGVCEGRDWHPYYWVKAANEEYFLPIFNILKSEHSYAKVSYYFLFLTTQSFLAGQKKPLKLHLYH